MQLISEVWQWYFSPMGSTSTGCRFRLEGTLAMIHSYLSLNKNRHLHYSDVIMDVIASQITSLTIVCSTVYSDADQRKHQSSASLAFVPGIHRWPVNSPHKWPVTRKMYQFDDVIMCPDNGCSVPSQYMKQCFTLLSIKHLGTLLSEKGTTIQRNII